MAQWRPMGAGQDYGSTLYEGIMPWMKAPLADWTRQRVHSTWHGQTSRLVELVQSFDSLTRRVQTLAPGFRDRGFSLLVDSLEHEGGYIEFLDYLVSVYGDSLGEYYDPDALRVLDDVLAQAGSTWKVGQREGFVGLERRVLLGVQEAADQAMAAHGHSGTLLSEAWHAAFGVSPDFEKAYSKAVKAAEAAIIPVVIPNATDATLGKALGQMRSDGNWKLDMTREHGTSTTAQTILDLAQALWTGQNDRHAGQAGYTASTREEGEAAVFLAVPLVQFFTSGAVARR